MIQLVEYGYLQTPYLSEFPYLVGAAEQGLAVQTQFAIIAEKTAGVEALANITKDKLAGLQFSGLINDWEKTKGLQNEFAIRDEGFAGVEALAFNTKEDTTALQSTFNIAFEKGKGLQFKANTTQDDTTAVQFSGLNQPNERTKPFQFQPGNVPHLECFGDGYLNEEPYLSLFPYLSSFTCAAMGLQFERVEEVTKGFQYRAVLYNTTNLRVLTYFPSRGTTGSNWTSTSTQPSSTNGFSVNNLNTDIVEQYWRSATSVLSATLTCDTQLTQGVYLDTLAILNHNLSGSATVILQGSDDPSFATIPVNITLQYEQSNMYYIAPELPNLPYRYWRLNISDPGSPDDFLRIGTIVFGAATIFTVESFVDRVRFGQRQFVDKVYTEGFTNVSNDRGKKKFLSLDFRNLSYGLPNFHNMREIFDYAGTILKCLWIPVPQQASRFAVFGKLAEIPPEEHNYKGADADYIDFSIEVDESL